jgi:hypothetical protein
MDARNIRGAGAGAGYGGYGAGAGFGASGFGGGAATVTPPQRGGYYTPVRARTRHTPSGLHMTHESLTSLTRACLCVFLCICVQPPRVDAADLAAKVGPTASRWALETPSVEQVRRFKAWATELDRGLAPPASVAPPGAGQMLGAPPAAAAPISETRALEVLSLLEQSEVRRSAAALCDARMIRARLSAQKPCCCGMRMRRWCLTRICLSSLLARVQISLELLEASQIGRSVAQLRTQQASAPVAACADRTLLAGAPPLTPSSPRWARPRCPRGAEGKENGTAGACNKARSAQRLAQSANWLAAAGGDQWMERRCCLLAC